MSILTSLSRYLARPHERRREARRNYIRRIFWDLILPIAGGWQRANSPVFLQARPDFHYDGEDLSDFPELYRKWVAGNNPMRSDLSRLYAILLNCRQVLTENIPGDIAELGTWKGNSAAILADIFRSGERKLFLFDTFSGFDRRDFVGDDSANTTKHFADTSLDQVRRLVGGERTIFVQGYFPESLKSDARPALSRYAVVHIDCDLYVPMMAGLEFFYPRTSDGGLLMLHDYGSGRWPGATAAVDEFFRDKPERVVIMPDKAGTAIVRRCARRETIGA